MIFVNLNLKYKIKNCGDGVARADDEESDSSLTSISSGLGIRTSGSSGAVKQKIHFVLMHHAFRIDIKDGKKELNHKSHIANHHFLKHV